MKYLVREARCVDLYFTGVLLRIFSLSAFMSCKDIGWQQTARKGGGAGRGKRVGNESPSYRVAYNTEGQSPAVHRSMIESVMML